MSYVKLCNKDTTLLFPQTKCALWTRAFNSTRDDHSHNSKQRKTFNLFPK